MKKILSVTLVLTMLLGTLCIFPASAERFSNSINYGEYWYIVLDDKTVAIGADNPDLSGTLIIPETINGYTVTEIAHSGFSGTKITEAVIPDTVTRLNDYAFSYNSELKKVDIPYSVTALGEGTFKECPELKSIFIPDSVIDMGYFSVGYEDSYYIVDGVKEYDGGYMPVGITIEGYKGSAAERYAKDEIAFFDFKARDEEYKEAVLKLLNIPNTDNGYYAEELSYSEEYRYHSEVAPRDATPDYVLIDAFYSVVTEGTLTKKFGDYVLSTCEITYPSLEFGYYIYLPEKNEVYLLKRKSKVFTMYSPTQVSASSLATLTTTESLTSKMQPLFRKQLPT